MTIYSKIFLIKALQKPSQVSIEDTFFHTKMINSLEKHSLILYCTNLDRWPIVMRQLESIFIQRQNDTPSEPLV